MLLFDVNVLVYAHRKDDFAKVPAFVGVTLFAEVEPPPT